MTNRAVSLDGANISLALSNGAKSTQPLSTLNTIYCLFVGSDVLSNDSLCHLLVFESELWLLPEFTPGLASITECPELEDILNRSVVAMIDHLPMSWRQRFLIFPGLEPDTKIVAISQLEKIQNKLRVKPELNCRKCLR